MKTPNENLLELIYVDFSHKFQRGSVEQITGTNEPYAIIGDYGLAAMFAQAVHQRGQKAGHFYYASDGSERHMGPAVGAISVSDAFIEKEIFGEKGLIQGAAKGTICLIGLTEWKKKHQELLLEHCRSNNNSNVQIATLLGGVDEGALKKVLPDLADSLFKNLITIPPFNAENFDFAKYAGCIAASYNAKISDEAVKKLSAAKLQNLSQLKDAIEFAAMVSGGEIGVENLPPYLLD